MKTKEVTASQIIEAVIFWLCALCLLSIVFTVAQ